MTRIKGHDYIWSNSWIQFKAPNAQGVYCLQDKEGKVLFIGAGAEAVSVSAFSEAERG